MDRPSLYEHAPAFPGDPEWGPPARGA
jgi:hypothetical protein